MKDEVNEALKRTHNIDLVVKSVDWNILHELCKVLVSFKSLTDVASSTFIGLSVIPLIRAKVTAACGPCDADCANIAQLKRHILACVNKRFPMNDFIIIPTLLDLASKNKKITKYVVGTEATELLTACNNDTRELWWLGD